MTRVGLPRAARHVHRGGAAHAARPRRGRGGAVPRRPDVIAAVERGEVDLGVVPIENSIEGSVTVTLDTLAFDTDLLIQREVDLPVSLNLCAPPGHDARRHHAPSCRSRTRSASAGCGWPRTCPTPSRGRRQLHRRGGPAGGEVEAHRAWRRSAPRRAPSMLRPRGARHATSRTTPRTRPASCSSATASPRRPATTRRRSSASSAQDRPGSLLAILQEFAARAINLTKLESRPTKRGLGDYCFFIDFEGHVADEVVADCLRNLAAKQAEVKFLGSYPVAGRRRPRRAARAVTKAWRDADDVGRRAARADPRRRTRVIDLKRLRDEPEYRARHRAQARRAPV